jgi:hypothetical protein
VKIDKSLYTKQEFKLIKEQKRKEKNKKKLENLQHLKPDDDIAFVVGNGKSRENIDLNNLKKHGIIYGCNALYRHFSPNFLIAVDVKMVLEINKAGYQNSNTVWTNPNKAFDRMKNFNYFQPSKGWSSGPTALWFAAQKKYKKIYILGFDFKGLDNGKKFNNIFADTPNYKRSNDGATFFGNWMRQTKTVINDNPNINFVRIINDDTYNPEELMAYKNYYSMEKDFFSKHFM